MAVTAAQCYITVRLTADEVCMAASHAIIRRRAKLIGERQDRAQKEDSNWDNEVEGACAELAFCKHHRVYWSGVSGLRAKDSALMEVRWTRHYDVGGLIVYRLQADASRLVLMDGHSPNYRIIGWTTGGEAKLPEFFNKDAGYFLMPRRLLRPYMEGEL